MNKILSKGNLPNHLQAFAKELGGQLASVPNTEFYEMNSISEFEKNAVDIGYEIVPTLDASTNRGFLVGFDVTEPQKIATLVDYSTLKVYFVECCEADLNAWVEKIKKHREMQQAEMFKRRDFLHLNRQQRRAIKFRGGKS